LYVLQIEDRAQNPSRRLYLRGLAIASGVRPEAITPYWHVPAPMTRHDTSSFNHAIYLPKGKFATTPQDPRPVAEFVNRPDRLALAQQRNQNHEQSLYQADCVNRREQDDLGWIRSRLSHECNLSAKVF
jgi:hypothetical protein